MPSYNKVILMGNLSRDPELRVTPTGKSICTFGIAVNSTWKGADGQQRQDVTFVDIEAWGRLGEVIAQYMTIGKPILVEGRLKLDSWEDKTTGAKRSKLKVVLETFQFVGSKSDGEQAQADPPQAAPRSYQTPKKAEPVDEDVPF